MTAIALALVAALLAPAGSATAESQAFYALIAESKLSSMPLERAVERLEREDYSCKQSARDGRAECQRITTDGGCTMTRVVKLSSSGIGASSVDPTFGVSCD